MPVDIVLESSHVTENIRRDPRGAWAFATRQTKYIQQTNGKSICCLPEKCLPHLETEAGIHICSSQQR